MVSIILVIGGFIAVAIGLTVAYRGQQKRKLHQLVTETPTTEVQNIDSEGRVELTGEISSPADGGDFASPIGQRDNTVFSGWKAEEWNERGDHSSWKTLSSGIHTEPFYLDDGTGQVQVTIDNQANGGSRWIPTNRSIASEGVSPNGVVCEFNDFPVVKEVGAESESPAHIGEFVRGERSLSAQSGSITNIVDIGNAHGDRRYSEGTLGLDEEIYLIGHAETTNGATTPLHPDDVVITPGDDGQFLISNLSEDALTDRLSTSYRFALAGGAVVIVIGIGLLVAGTTPLL
jgi:hypothetical protein